MKAENIAQTLNMAIRQWEIISTDKTEATAYKMIDGDQSKPTTSVLCNDANLDCKKCLAFGKWPSNSGGTVDRCIDSAPHYQFFSPSSNWEDRKNGALAIAKFLGQLKKEVAA